MNRKLFPYLALVATLLGSRAIATAQDAAQPGQLDAPSIGALPANANVPSKPRGHIETELLSVDVSSENGGFTSALIKSERFARDGKLANLVTTDKPGYLPFGLELEGVKNDGQGFALEQVDARTVRLSRTLDGVRITRKIEAGGPYQLWLTTRIENASAETRKLRLSLSTHHYVTRESEGSNVPILPVNSPTVSTGLCRHDDELEREHRDNLAAPLSFNGTIQFTGIASVYFLNALSPERAADVERCTIVASDRGLDADREPLGTLFSAHLVHRPLELKAGEAHTYKTLAYVGPKVPEELGIAGHGLKQAIEGGWFSSLSEGLTWLLRAIHERVGNWGVAIILLTLLVKTVLFPLTAKQMQSMGRMKELKPEIDRINELYADDREKKGAAVMELYRKKGINPMAGCFPVLLQLPIWFSLYASLSTNVELLQAPFMLWWRDLSSPDPYFVLPLALGALMYVQQKMAPVTGGDPMQQKMMLYMMPIMMTSFMLFLPAGLCLYTLTNSALSIGQQRLIEARLRRAHSSKAESADKDDDEPTTSSSGTSADSSSISQPFRLNRPSKAERRSRRGK